jgi:hypothetical protein
MQRIEDDRHPHDQQGADEIAPITNQARISPAIRRASSTLRRRLFHPLIHRLAPYKDNQVFVSVVPEAFPRACSLVICGTAPAASGYVQENIVPCPSDGEAETAAFIPHVLQAATKISQLKNVVFLDRVGDALRRATTDIAKEDLPENIRLLLRRLERLERKETLKKNDV